MLVFIMFLAATMTYNANANSSGSYSYTPVPNDLTVEIKYPLEAFPNQTISVNVTIEALVNLTVNQLKIELHTFNNSTMREEVFNYLTYIEKENPVPLNSFELWNETANVTIPLHASSVVYGKLVLEWGKKGTEGWETIGRESTFIMTYLRNPELERLKSKVAELKEENAELNGNITALNDTIRELNNSLTELLNNLTKIENRYKGELSGTRSVITILAITTIFFVATTAYLFLRRPKQYW